MAITTAQGTEIIAGIDTHQDLHTAAIVNLDGTVLGTESFSTTRADTERCCVGSGLMARCCA